MKNKTKRFIKEYGWTILASGGLIALSGLCITLANKLGEADIEIEKLKNKIGNLSDLDLQLLSDLYDEE